jgi:V/A-type H+-transporting ATPase subunit C
MLFGGSECFSGSVKARARKGDLLSAADFKNLLACHSLEEITRYLVNTRYGTYLPKGVDKLNRQELEVLLLLANNTEAFDFRSCLDLARRKLLDIWLERTDVVLLKMVIQSVILRETPMSFIQNFTKGVAFTLMDIDRLLSASTLPDVIGSILNPRLVTFIEEATKRAVGGTSVAFTIGMALDWFYFRSVYGAMRRIGGEEGNRLQQLSGTTVDLTNITWIYRARKFYGMNEEMALSYILYARFRVRFDLLSALAAAPPEKMWELLEGTSYDGVLPKPDDSESGAFIEARVGGNVLRKQREVALNVFLSGTPGLHDILAYLQLRDLEVRDLSAIIEAVRYDYDRKKAVAFLTRPIEGW